MTVTWWGWPVHAKDGRFSFPSFAAALLDYWRSVYSLEYCLAGQGLGGDLKLALEKTIGPRQAVLGRHAACHAAAFAAAGLDKSQLLLSELKLIH